MKKLMCEMVVDKLEQESSYGRRSGHVGFETKVEIDADGIMLPKPESDRENTGYIGIYSLPSLVRGWKLGDRVRVTIEKI